MRGVILLLSLLLSTSALAEPKMYLSWVTEDGVIGFTDNIKAVPFKYRADVQEVFIDGLQDYEKATIRSDDGAYEQGLQARLSHLRSQQ